MISLSSVVQGVSSGLLTAIASNKQFNSVPILYVPGTQTSLSNVGESFIEGEPYFGIRLENSAYKVNAQSAISTQVLVSINADGTTTKQYITDNVAPGPRSWTISGWISSNNLFSALFTPVNLLGVDTSTRDQVRKMWKFFYSRTLGKFRDKDGVLWPYVAIESLDLEADPLTENKIPIQITIKEVNVLTLDDSGISTTAVTNDPASVSANPTDLSTALNNVLADPSSVLSQVFTS